MSTPALPPNMQALLGQLFELFSTYIVADNVREQSAIHAQILDVFSRLGVVSDSIAVRRAAEIFESITREPIMARPREVTLASEARDFVASQLRTLERGPNAPTLTTGARQLLRTPVVEVAEFAAQFEPEQVASSLDALFLTLREPPINPAEGSTKIRTSVAVIRAFSKNFCRIPPFCSGGDRR
jgi:hypothetical protein